MLGASAILLALTAWLLFRRGRACPADPELAKLCETAQRWNIRIFWVAIGIWVIGFSAAYLALPVYSWLLDAWPAT